MHRRKGFTLIELLMVIAIIALLMAILMPALARVRKQAKTVVCQANLRQWSLIFSMYGDDNDGRIVTFGMDGQWLQMLKKYLQDKSYEIHYCPMARKPENLLDPAGNEVDGPGMNQNPFAAWGKFGNGAALIYQGHSGSYGINVYLYDPTFALPTPGAVRYRGRLVRNFWKGLNVKKAGKIPLFADAFHTGGGPTQTDNPPTYDGERWQSGATDEMKRFCLNRHNGYINVLFLDSSVRKTGLKELWRLQWHQSFDTRAALPVWPDWMRALRDYN